MTMETTTGTSRTAHALTRLAGIAFAFVKSQALLSACELGVFDALADGPISSDDLAEEIHIKPIACRRLLMALASLDLVACQEGTFRNTDLGEFCTSKGAVNLRAISNVNPFYHMFEHLSDALREYSPRWQQALGTTPQDAFASLYVD